MQLLTTKHNQDIEEVKERLGTMKVGRFQKCLKQYTIVPCMMSVPLVIRW